MNGRKEHRKMEKRTPCARARRTLQPTHRNRHGKSYAWVVLLGTVLAIFALGILFGYGLRGRATTGRSHTTNAVRADIITPKAEPAESDAPTELIHVVESDEYSGIPGVPISAELQIVMRDSCENYNVPLALAIAVAEAESGFDPDAVSPTDDHGMMQINRCNFERLQSLGLDPLTYADNIEAGVMMLGAELELCGDEELAVMAYNLGHTGAQRLWSIGTCSTDYSRSVMELYAKWATVLGGDI